MANARDLRRIALSLEGTTEAPHFDRTAFKVARIYATLAADGRTANLALAPDEQELKCLTASDAFQPVPNAWGRRGWTTVRLAALSAAELRDALTVAWGHALPKRPTRKEENTMTSYTASLRSSKKISDQNARSVPASPKSCPN